VRSSEFVVLSWCAPLALGGALLCWPYRPGRSRAADIHAAPRRTRRWRGGPHQPPVLVVAVLAGGVGLIVAGAAGGLAAAVAGATVVVRLRARRAAVSSLAVTAELAASLGLLCGELRAGGHPAPAAERVDAALAGPRATALVLAGLPVLGLLMGQLVGARPWLVLTRAAAGQLLLGLGALLTCAGLIWSARLMAKVSAP
jgi:tight adherence protein B